MNRSPAPTPTDPPLRIEIDAAQAGERIDRTIAVARPELSRSRVKVLIEQGHLKLAGATIEDPSLRVKPGQVFELELPEAAPARPQGQAIDLDVIYEDEDLIVID